MPKHLFSKPPKKGQPSTKKLQLRARAKNPARIRRIQVLLAGVENPPFDLMRESQNSSRARFCVDHFVITTFNSESKFDKNALYCLFDLPFDTAVVCLGVGETLLKEIKKVFYPSRWPCVDVYRNGLPMTPQHIFEFRRRYMAWLKNTSPRLLFALQLAEKASLAHQMLLAPDSWKCDLIKASEAAKAASDAFLSAPSPTPGLVIASEEAPTPVLDFSGQDEEQHQEESFYVVSEGDDGGVNVTDVATGEDCGEIYNSLFDEF